jgi:hypothetical protein
LLLAHAVPHLLLHLIELLLLVVGENIGDRVLLKECLTSPTFLEMAIFCQPRHRGAAVCIYL